MAAMARTKAVHQAPGAFFQARLAPLVAVRQPGEIPNQVGQDVTVQSRLNLAGVTERFDVCRGR